MKVSQLNLAAALLCFGLALLAFGDNPDPKRRSEESVAPEGAALVVDVDLLALRRSPIANFLELDRLEELSSIRRECGHDPIHDTSRLTIVVSEASPPDIGLFARGSFSKSLISGCAERLIRKRSGSVIVGRHDDFVTLSDDRARGRLAVRDGGPLIIATGPLFDQLLAAFYGRIPTIAHDPTHRSLRVALSPHALLRLSSKLSAGWLERWLEMPEAAGSAWANVRGIGAELTAENSLSLRLLIATDDTASARQIEGLIRGMLKRPEARGSDAELLLKNLKSKATGQRVVLSVAWDARESAEVLRRMRDLLAEQLSFGNDQLR